MENLLNIRILGVPELEKFVSDLPGIFDTTAILDEGAAVLFNRIRTRFLQETDPSGQRWPESKAAQKRSRIGRGGGTLFDTGKLFYSLQLYAESLDTRAIGTDATSQAGFAYPIVHQYGLANFPKRTFLGFADEDVTYMSDLVIKRLSERLGV